MRNDFEFTPFKSGTNAPQGEPVTLTRLRVKQDHKKTMQSANTKSMWIKIGLCGVFLLAVIIAELTLFSTRGEPAETETVLSQSETGEEETPGKLQFVSENGVISVFSGTQKWSSPVAVENCELKEEGPVLYLTAKAGELVKMPAAGEVKEIGEDEALGAFVRVRHSAALESVYYGLDAVQVEVGQPLLAGDSLGKVADAGEIRVMIMENGQAQNPADYIDTNTAY